MMLAHKEFVLRVKKALQRLNADDITFFRLAHVWSFGTDPDLSNDVKRFKETDFVPAYVQKYLDEIQN